MAATQVPVTLDTPIVIKILFRGQTKKIKLPLKDLGANVLPEKLRTILQIDPEDNVVFERYSDSAASYVTLDSDKPQVYKTLFRAAKAKLKLRLRATLPDEQVPAPLPLSPPQTTADTPSLHRMSSDTLTPANAYISPVIAHSPAPKVEAVSPVTPPKPVDAEGEAPVPQPFTTRQSIIDDHWAEPDRCGGFAFRPKLTNTTWVVYCNNCNHPMENEHFHCSVCDGGDYDLCPSCVDAGIHCPGSGHWMVKRLIVNGVVHSSTTRRILPQALPKAAPKVTPKVEVKVEERKEIPGAFTEEKPVPVAEEEEPTRTCNCCVKELPEKEFVTCTACEDYDLCLLCHVDNKHGHHPGHAFKAAVPETALPILATVLCNSGRNVRHSAVCDGCDKFIYGVRHKCLHCPDWDYCSECLKNAEFIHPRHRFVPIYEPLAEPMTSTVRHYGIYCDGPLCRDRENLSYVEGIRYKCAVCNDTDFCQNCEAHPSNKHNRTHPLIKFKTPVRSVCVTTVNEDHSGKSIAKLGDHVAERRSTATETTAPAPSSNAATQVQTIVDVKPSEEPQAKKKIMTIRDLLGDTIEPVQEKTPEPVEESKPQKTEDKTEGVLDAHFIRDTIVDGSKICAGYQFVQVWTLRNPGPNAWPAGCSVRHVGGDNMLNIDNSRPLSHMELVQASETNTVTRAVEPGEEVSFRVVMKAPAREGTAISYWRLKTAEGLPFGHRLWCDIQVVAPAAPTFSPVIKPENPPMPAAPAPQAQAHGVRSPLHERLHQARLERMKMAQAQAVRPPQVVHHETMERIQRVRKAAVERLLENRRKEHEAALAFKRSMTSNKAVSPPPVAVPAELPVREKQIEKEIEKQPEPAQPQASGMIFPQLDKESPESSTYESSTTVQPESPMSEKSTIARTVTVASDDEFFEDAESVALHSDDDGFMTDEEYDILDASDEELS